MCVPAKVFDVEKRDSSTLLSHTRTARWNGLCHMRSLSFFSLSIVDRSLRRAMSTTRERYLQWRHRSLLPQLPVEMWAEILSYLTIADLRSMRLVSRLLNSCVNQHTNFWSRVIFDLDHCPLQSVPPSRMKNMRSSNLELFTKSNRYAHCELYFPAEALSSLKARRKRRQRRLNISQYDKGQWQNEAYLRCSAVHFQSLRLFDQVQLECLLKRRIRHLEFSHECLINEPSLNFLCRLERLRSLKITFVHNINALDAFALMLVNAMQAIMLLLLKLSR